MSEGTAPVESETGYGYSKNWQWQRFGIPRYGLATEVPTAFRELVENSTAQAKENCEIMKAGSRVVADLVENSYSRAAEGFAGLTAKIFDATRVNSDAAFEFAAQLMVVKSPLDMAALSSAHVRRQMELISEQSKDVAVLAQKLTMPASDPDRTGMSRTSSRTSEGAG